MALHTFEAWCDEFGLSVNHDKTGIIAITKRRKLSGFFEPRLFVTTKHRSLSVKYLGVILDSRLAWKEHVDVKVREALNSTSACMRACEVTWGLRSRVFNWLFVTIIRLQVKFASLVWWSGCQTASSKRKVSTIQRLACLGIAGAIRTTPTNVVGSLICLLH